MNIPTFIINLEKRSERKAHSLQQFDGHAEFKLQIIKAIEDSNGALGLWLTIKHIIKDLTPKEEPFILICEDDHQFTSHYNKEKLFQAIQEAEQKQADLLMGGVSWFSDALQISKNLFWVDEFTGNQFLIVYRRFFNRILQTDLLPGEVADKKMAAMSTTKFCMVPFISIQKEFGYSDVTAKNNTLGYVDQIFSDTSEKLEHLVKVASFYQIKL